MANILLLDDSDVATRAMKGILARGNHRTLSATNVADAWNLLRSLVKFDLLITELKFQGENGLSFITRLKADCVLKNLPIVVYTGIAEHAVVKKALSLGIQNYLIKPYQDGVIYAEIAKTQSNPWRNLSFEEERSFCAQFGYAPAELKRMRENVARLLADLKNLLPRCNEAEGRAQIPTKISELSTAAENAGVWCVVDQLAELQPFIETSRWNEVPPFVENMEFLERFLYSHEHPEHLPEGFLTDDEKKLREEARERDRWMFTDVRTTGPLTTKETLQLQIDNLPGCPTADSVAAAFSMTANGQASSLNPITDLVSRDAGLSTQVIIAANKLERDGMNAVDDPRLAIGLLGENRLNSLSKTTVSFEDRHMLLPPISWPHYWMFQMGVARLTHYACSYLEFNDLQPIAYTAGLLHDIGKLLLLRIHPFAFQAIVTHSRNERIPLSDAEKHYLDWTTREMGEHFARHHNIPEPFCQVIRWVEEPELAHSDAELVALVSFARSLCLHNHVGYCGDTPHDTAPNTEETGAWRVIRNRVFPSFNLKKFEAETHSYCANLRKELLGRLH